MRLNYLALETVNEPLGVFLRVRRYVLEGDTLDKNFPNNTALHEHVEKRWFLT